MSIVSTGFKVPPLAWIPISAAIVAETVSNGLRAYGLGTHLEKFTVSVWGVSVSLAGAVLVLAAVAVSLSQARAAWLALMPGPARQRIVAGLAAVLLLGVSVTAMVTHIWEADRAKIGAESGQNTDYTNAKALYDGVAGQVEALKRFGPEGKSLPRPREAVQTQINALNINWGIWTRSKQCTDITKEESKGECGKVLPLYEEQGAYASLVLLEPKLNDAKAKLDATPKPIETVTSFEETVLKWWAFAMGLAVVFIATFGAVIWAKPTSDKSSATPAKSVTVTDNVENVTDGRDMAAMAEVPTQLAGVSDTELQRLRQWYFSQDEEEAGKPTPDPKPRKRSRRAQKKETAIMKLRARTLSGEKPKLRVIMSRHKVSKATASRWRSAAMAG